jgi:hypothetical protein
LALVEVAMVEDMDLVEELVDQEDIEIHMVEKLLEEEVLAKVILL